MNFRNGEKSLSIKYLKKQEYRVQLLTESSMCRGFKTNTDSINALIKNKKSKKTD